MGVVLVQASLAWQAVSEGERLEISGRTVRADPTHPDPCSVQGPHCPRPCPRPARLLPLPPPSGLPRLPHPPAKADRDPTS